MGRRRTVGIKHMTREQYNAYYREANQRMRQRRKEQTPKQEVVQTHKACATCKVEFPLTEEFFYKSTKSKLGVRYFHSWCKTCTNAYNISRKFNIPREQYERMRGQHCDICWRFGRMYVDHCHLTKQIRGMLCLNCNTALGQMKDRPDLLRRAAEYLEERS
jgi:hypothetical protein